MAYLLRDDKGRIVGHARSKAAAHRSSRSGRRLGASVNRAVPQHGRRFGKSDKFIAVFAVTDPEKTFVSPLPNNGMIVYEDPSLSTVRVKAKIAADVYKIPVAVVDQDFKPIATYAPGRIETYNQAAGILQFGDLGVGQTFWFDAKRTTVRGATYRPPQGPYVKVSDTRYRDLDDSAGKFLYEVSRKSAGVSRMAPSEGGTVWGKHQARIEAEDARMPKAMRDVMSPNRSSNMAKLSRGGRVITLGRRDTRRWEDGGPDGDAFRRRIREMAHSIADKTGKSVEIYASKSAGGWMADQILPGG